MPKPYGYPRDWHENLFLNLRVWSVMHPRHPLCVPTNGSTTALWEMLPEVRAYARCETKSAGCGAFFGKQGNALEETAGQINDSAIHLTSRFIAWPDHCKT